jgi:hypothetical protein
MNAGSHEIFVMNADGTGVTRLTRTFIGYVTSLAWQPVVLSWHAERRNGGQV